MSAYEIKVSITPLCPCCGKESQSSGFVAESRAPQGVFDRDNPTERTDQRVFITPCAECFVFRGDVIKLIEAAQAARASMQHMRGPESIIHERTAELDAALAHVKGGAA
ncbi:TPA: hypothetical protein QEK28_000274 [Stenotrophomonas maltophilia]|uniref:hypothetical protein n=1 Tax=Stenotrophomonas TaxID=40323 RepID=UPI00131348B1|nr:hypothetical protein [Stenotrophomonas sp. Sm0581]MDQ7301918.1 hypothetical protein [Stenotrophomonas sp. Sm0581]HDS1303479.1 hypothetical protein [Stenotrophomonas maltophilia]